MQKAASTWSHKGALKYTLCLEVCSSARNRSWAIIFLHSSIIVRGWLCVWGGSERGHKLPATSNLAVEQQQGLLLSLLNISDYMCAKLLRPLPQLPFPNSILLITFTEYLGVIHDSLSVMPCQYIRESGCPNV